jgi:hypothetical protein
MSVIGAVGRSLREMFSRSRGLYRFTPSAVDLLEVFQKRTQLAFGLQPMDRIATILPTRFLPNMIGSSGDRFVIERSRCIHFEFGSCLFPWNWKVREKGVGNSV